MSRNVIIVRASQVVVSENHPEGLYSEMPGFPKFFDSFNYDGDIKLAMNAAKSAYYDQLSKNYAYTNRAMTTVILENAFGQQILHDCVGEFPVETIQPEESEEPEVEPGE